MKVKLYDAENGVVKGVKKVVRVSIYNDKIIIVDNMGTEYFIPSEEFENHCVYISDNKVRKNND